MLRDVINRGKVLADKVTSMVMNYTEVETKVRDATNDDAWGPTTAIMQEIAQLTHTPQHYNEVMNGLWTRLLLENPSGGYTRTWRRIYKSLVLLDYLTRHGSERVVNSVRDHNYDLKQFEAFYLVDEFGRDQGVHVRTKVRHLQELVADDTVLREERQRARHNRSKFCGFSSVEAPAAVGSSVQEDRNSPQLRKQRAYTLGDIDEWHGGEEPGTARYLVHQVLQQVREVWESSRQPPNTESAASDDESDPYNSRGFQSGSSRTFPLHNAVVATAEPMTQHYRPTATTEDSADFWSQRSRFTNNSTTPQDYKDLHNTSSTYNKTAKKTSDTTTNISPSASRHSAFENSKDESLRTQSLSAQSSQAAVVSEDLLLLDLDPVSHSVAQHVHPVSNEVLLLDMANVTTITPPEFGDFVAATDKSSTDASVHGESWASFSVSSPNSGFFVSSPQSTTTTSTYLPTTNPCNPPPSSSPSMAASSLWQEVQGLRIDLSDNVVKPTERHKKKLTLEEMQKVAGSERNSFTS